MKTTSHISNIGYLNREQNEKVLQVICQTQPKSVPCIIWICHKGETTPDEPDKRDKDHTHILLPATGDQRNTDNFSDVWYLPIGNATAATPFWRKTKSISEWLLYSVHNSKYLAHKGEDEKEFTYPWDDVQVTTADGTRPITEDDYWLREVRDAKSMLRRLGSLKGDVLLRYLIKCAQDGTPFEQLVMQGDIPINLHKQSADLYHSISATAKRLSLERAP